MAKETKPRIDLTGQTVSGIAEMFNSKYGENTLAVARQAQGMKIKYVSTGVYALDFALGGGIPKNRISEIRGHWSSGKTTISLTTIANFQRMHEEGEAAFIDLEHTFDPSYAQRLGVDLNRLHVVNPESGEQAVDVITDLLSILDKDVFIVVDSIAALVPMAEIEASAEQQSMGLQARLVNKLMRIATARLKRSMYKSLAASATVLCLNQIRNKIGVIYGCGRGKTPIPFVDGTSAYLKEVVKNKISKHVWAYDSLSSKFVPAKITSWFNNGKASRPEDFIRISTESYDSLNGRQGAEYTKNHKVLTNKGWQEVRSLRVGDSLLSRYESILNSSFGEFVLGMSVGDCHLAGPHKKKALQISDFNDPEYLQWKLFKLKDGLSFNSHPLRNKKKKRTYQIWTSDYRTDLGILKSKIQSRNPLPILHQFSLLSLAVWYMDDGSLAIRDSGSLRASLSIKRFSNNPEVLRRVSLYLRSLGFNNYISLKYGNISFTPEGSEHFLSCVARYVPVCMAHKLPQDMRGKYREFNLSFEREQIPIPVKILALKNGYLGEKLDKYDIKVEGYSNYLAGGKLNGFVVHNSPETTPGGMGKDFAYAVAMKVFSSPSDIFKQDVTVNGVKRTLTYGKTIKFVINKNKCGGSQYEEGEFIFYQRRQKNHKPLSFNNLEELFRYAVFFDIIHLNGKEYNFGNITYKQESKFIEALSTRPNACAKIYTAVMQKITEKEV